MKISCDIDCTPEEARRLLGLPDLSSIHAVYLEKTKRLVEDGVTPDAVEAMMRSWSPMGEAGMAMWRQLFEQMGSSSRA